MATGNLDMGSKKAPSHAIGVEKDAGTEDTKGLYTCPMHPEIVQQGPGTCPRCGMALEPRSVLPAATGIEYT